jgi:uncharacterized phage protein (predicted DNA packaging)
MSEVSIESVKRDLRIIHDDDDTLLQELIDAAEKECLNFINAEYLPGLEPNSEETSSELTIEPDAARGIRLIVRGGYEETDIMRMAAYRNCAEALWMPYREGLGV